MTPLEIFIGLRLCKPLIALFAKALVLYQNHKEGEGFEEFFTQILEDDTESLNLFDILNQDIPVKKNSVPYAVRCILLILDHEIAHDLINILSNADKRGIYVSALIVTKEIGAIMFNLDDLNDLEEGYLAKFLYEEMLNLKSCINKYFKS